MATNENFATPHIIVTSPSTQSESLEVKEVTKEWTINSEKSKTGGDISFSLEELRELIIYFTVFTNLYRHIIYPNPKTRFLGVKTSTLMPKVMHVMQGVWREIQHLSSYPGSFPNNGTKEAFWSRIREISEERLSEGLLINLSRRPSFRVRMMGARRVVHKRERQRRRTFNPWEAFLLNKAPGTNLHGPLVNMPMTSRGTVQVLPPAALRLINYYNRRRNYIIDRLQEVREQSYSGHP